MAGLVRTIPTLERVAERVVMWLVLPTWGRDRVSLLSALVDRQEHRERQRCKTGAIRRSAQLRHTEEDTEPMVGSSRSTVGQEDAGEGVHSMEPLGLEAKDMPGEKVRCLMVLLARAAALERPACQIRLAVVPPEARA